MSIVYSLTLKTCTQLVRLVTVLALIMLVMPLAAQDVSGESQIIQATTTLFGTDVRTVDITDTFESTNVAPWFNAGYRGHGVRVGVIDAGFIGLEQFENLAGIDVQLPSGADYQNRNMGDHGVRVLDVIHTIAPEAQLFACRYFDFETFSFCVDIMTNTFNVDIINHSAGVFLSPIDGRSPWAQLVDQAVFNSNVLWVNSSGNGHQGVINDIFASDGRFPQRHQFRIGKIGTRIEFPQVAEPETISNSSQRRIMLGWESLSCDPTLPNSLTIPANELDLQLRVIFTDGRGGETTSSQTQLGRREDIPVDQLDIPLTRPFLLEVWDVTQTDNMSSCPGSTTAAAGVEISLYVEFAGIPQATTPTSLTSPADSRSALVVGALSSSGDGVAIYSSRGTVGESGFVRPDLVAPGELALSSILNGQEFIGTSASAAYVSGVAALVGEAFPDYSGQAIANYLKQFGVVQFANLDTTDAGNGRLRLPDTFPPPPRRPDEPGAVAAMPFMQTFDSTELSPDPLLGWRQQVGGGWRVEQRDAGPLLVGRGNLDRPIVVSGSPEPQWASQAGPLYVSFDIVLTQGAPGLRVVFRHNEETNSGYNVLEILEGELVLKRDDIQNNSGGFSDYIADRKYEIFLEGLSRSSAAIVPNRLYHIEMWIDGRQIFVYLDGLLVLRGQDNFAPQLQAGDFIFQALDAERDVLIDNLTILRPASASSHFEGGLLPADWTPEDFASVEVVGGAGSSGNNYLEMRGENRLEITEPIRDVVLDCRVASFQGGFSLRIEEASTGTAFVEMEYREDRTRLFQVDSQGNNSWERTQEDSGGLRNVFSRGWDQIRLSLVGDRLTLTKNGQTRFSGRIGQPLMLPYEISFETQGNDRLGIDDCLLFEVPIQSGQ